MTREETVKVFAVFKAAYPHSLKGLKRTDAEAMLSAWGMVFGDVPYGLIELAAKAYITGGARFFPTIPEFEAALESVYWEAWEVINDVKRGVGGHADAVIDWSRQIEAALYPRVWGEFGKGRAVIAPEKITEGKNESSDDNWAADQSAGA